MSNKLTMTAMEILAIESDLPLRFEYKDRPYPTVDDFEMFTFEQVWGSTALGFGGIGGQAMTSARTYVLVPINCDQKCFVYFAGRFAYKADYCNKLVEDIRAQRMEPVSGAGKYKR